MAADKKPSDTTSHPSPQTHHEDALLVHDSTQESNGDSSSSEASSESNLFRPEVLEEQGTKIFSQAVLLVPPSFWIVGGFFGLFTMFLMTFMVLGTYQQSITLKGHLLKFEVDGKVQFEGHFNLREFWDFDPTIGMEMMIVVDLPKGRTGHPVRHVQTKIAQLYYPRKLSEKQESKQREALVQDKHLAIKAVFSGQEVGSQRVQDVLQDGTPIKATVFTGRAPFYTLITQAFQREE